MYILTFWVETIPQPFVMRYSDRERALSVLRGFREAASGTSMDLTDDWEARVTLPRSRTLVSTFIDLERDIEAQTEIQVTQARANAALQSKIGADPVMGLHGRSGLVRAS